MSRTIYLKSLHEIFAKLNLIKQLRVENSTVLTSSWFKFETIILWTLQNQNALLHPKSMVVKVKNA